MMPKRLNNLILTLLIIGLSFVFFFPGHSHALDTDLYTVTGSDIPPNVLIILDNSSSMVNEDQEPPYNPNCIENPNCTTPPPVYQGPYLNNGVYKKESNDWVLWKNQISEIDCAQAKNALTYYGMWNGKMKADSSCGGNKKVSLQSGNFMNYLVLSQTSQQPRLGLAKGTIHSYVNTTEGVNFGLMVFNANGQGGRIIADILDRTKNPPVYDKNVMFKGLSGINAANVVEWTPLAETLYEAMLYFKGGPSYYNPGKTYLSPTQYWCQKNYIILITDGFPTYDVADPDGTFSHAPILAIGDYDGDGREPGPYGDPALKGSHYLDDVAKYIYLNDLSPELQGRQNITLYTIGFNPNQLALDSTLLQSAARNGGGRYHYCHNAQTFSAAFQSIIQEILEKSTSFVAPTVPISQMVKTESDNFLYLGMFKPTTKSFWKGNIKKFGIASSNGTDSRGNRFVVGDLLDRNRNLAIDPETNRILDTAVSYWSNSADGGEVEAGGVGEILKNMADLSQRKIYAYLNTAQKDLSHPSNAFTTGNISPGMLGLGEEEERDQLVNFLYGYDVYDEDFNPNTTKRGWILGSILHSRPSVVHYSSKTVIFAGGNDGMLHAFDDSNGQELWAFIPPNLLPKLKNLTGDSVEFFVDGAPKVYDVSGMKILVCGQRRGGSHYFALDITQWDRPKWLWGIHPGMANYNQMGQTWSTPLIGKIKYGLGEKLVLFIGGGYDDSNQDNLPAGDADTKGFAVYVVDILDGTLIWKYSKTENPKMKYSIPSDIARVDTDGDGRIDRLYVGDMGGQIWRFDIGHSAPGNLTGSWTGKLIFDSNNPPPPPGVDRRKIFYPPDVSLEKEGGNYELLLFGTGDREHPKSTSLYSSGYFDRLYTVKDRNSGSVLTPANLVDVTEDLLQIGTPEQKQATLNALRNASGWYINLSQNSGEKCLSSPFVFFGVSYFSTFTPPSDGITDPCFLSDGIGRLYALNYLNGNAVFNLDGLGTMGNLTRADRSTIIGNAIPSGIVCAVIGGSTVVSYGGVGGGVYKPPLKSSKVLIPVSWRQRF